tara:strand:- start:535 stop:768 length:234 start_codon:yes stop_codon:yes gene_type:complete
LIEFAVIPAVAEDRFDWPELAGLGGRVFGTGSEAGEADFDFATFAAVGVGFTITAAFGFAISGTTRWGLGLTQAGPI